MFPRCVCVGGGGPGNPTKNGDQEGLRHLTRGHLFWLCVTFDLGTVLTKKNTCLSF